jgi:hypothetical protein
MITDKDKKEAEEYCDQVIVGVDGKRFPQTVDAVAWAKEWLRTVEVNPTIYRDEGTMIGWFANAIMAGYDEAQRRDKVKIAAAKAELEKARALEEGCRFDASKYIHASRGIEAALKALSQ